MASTIADVAVRAGVSTATVSRVLSGIGGARPATRERVVEAARELGYRPSGIARSLKLRTTRTYGLIVTDIENPFFPQLVRAVEDAARDDGYAILLCNAADDPDREGAYLDLLVDRRVDGVVIAASSLGGRHREWLDAPPLPVVLVNCSAPGVHLPSITSDNRAGGRLALEHLVSLGHRRIGALTAPPRNVDGPDRLHGVRAGMKAAGLDPGDLPVASGEAGVAGGERSMRELLEASPDTTGVVAYNDLMAIGAMRAVRAAARLVPDDVSVVGFDDVDLAAFVDPPLTTIAQSTADMGRWAVARLKEAVSRNGNGATPGSSTAEVILPVRLVVRGSTARPPSPAG
jgi:LacI family transcriptional regulator, galactose operon repressor